jgi:excisionase family DNA binding protein
MQNRDGKGRLLAPDGWPMGGLARVSEAVGFLQLSRSKVYALVREGSLRSVQFGKSRRLRWEDLRAVVAGASGEEVVR